MATSSVSADDDSSNNVGMELSFLDLGDCNQDTRQFLMSLIQTESAAKQEKIANDVGAGTTTARPETVEVAHANNNNPSQPQQPHHYQQQVYVSPPTSQPCVYINQVTANVNVHHGAEQPPPMKPLHHAPHAQPHAAPVTYYSGFPPPPPNPMAFATPPVVSGAHGMIPNGATPPGQFLPHQTPHHAPYIYAPQQIAALAAKAGAPPPVQPQGGQSLYMPHQVICYAYPIPVSQQTTPPQPPPAQPPSNLRPPLHSAPPMTQPQLTPPPPPVAAAPTIPAYQGVVTAQEKVEPSMVEEEPPKPVVPIPKAEEQNEPIQSESKQPEAEPVAAESAESTKPPQDGEEIPVDTKDEASEEASRKSSGGSKSWASLFHKDSPGGAALNHVTGKPMARIQPYTNVNGSEEEASLEGSGKPDKKKKTEGISSNAAAGASSLDPHNLELAKFLQSYGLSHRSCMIKPRGLSNRSNWCFVNAILQALVACPPFYNLMKSLPQETLRKASMVKITRVINDFVAEFSPLDHFPKLNRRDKGKKTEDLPLGMTFEASSIFQFLLCLSSETFRVEEGRQEDAEEFLTFLLNALNDEMLALVKLLNEDLEQEQRSEGEDDDDDDEWHQVGAKNKSLLTRRVGSSGASQLSPVGSIFQGQLQSCVTSSNGEPTATLQTFFTLPLDIQSKNIKNVSEALLHNFTSETIDDYVCSKTNKQIEASRSLFLDELPSVLILHLKRFVYDKTSSASCQKLLKNIDFPVDLEIPKDILSNNSKNKYALKQRSYKLFAVVYHNGKEASLGHYVTDVYHAGLGWLHCDDSLIKSMTESMVLAHSASSVPYILFYRRGDTMGPGPSVVSTSATSGSTASSAGSNK